MKKERKDSTRNHIKAMLALFCVMFIVLSVYLGYIVNVYGNRWFASPYNTRVERGPSPPACCWTETA